MTFTEQLKQSIADQETRGCLANALRVYQSMIERGEKHVSVARVCIAWSPYSVGDFVVVEWERIHDPYSGAWSRSKSTVTVEMPMTPKQIQRQRDNGSLLTTWLTVVGVPAKMVEILM